MFGLKTLIPPLFDGHLLDFIGGGLGGTRTRDQRLKRPETKWVWGPRIRGSMKSTNQLSLKLPLTTSVVRCLTGAVYSFLAGAHGQGLGHAISKMIASRRMLRLNRGWVASGDASANLIDSHSLIWVYSNCDAGQFNQTKPFQPVGRGLQCHERTETASQPHGLVF